MLKICKKCNVEKEITDFYYHNNNYDSKCKNCRNSINKASRLLKKDEINKLIATIRNTPEGKIIRKIQSLKYIYNLSIEEFKSMCDSQNNLCYICNRPPKKRYLTVDHDHKTGKVRGLLCSGCNAKLGWLESYKDNINKYLNL